MRVLFASVKTCHVSWCEVKSVLSSLTQPESLSLSDIDASLTQVKKWGLNLEPRALEEEYTTPPAPPWQAKFSRYRRGNL